MALIIPQGRNKGLRKEAVIIVTSLEDPFNYVKMNGKTPHYFMEDPKDTEVLYVSTEPFTLSQARKAYEVEFGEIGE